MDDIHSITIHGLAHEDIVVVVVAKDLLDGGGGVGLELVDGGLIGALLLELLEDLLHVGWDGSAIVETEMKEKGVCLTYS